MVKVRSGNVIHIPGGTIKMVVTTCSQYYFDSPDAVLFEPLTNGELLAAGLLVSPAMVKVFKGTACIPVVNVGTTETLLYPHTQIGVLSQVHIVSLPAGITEVGGEPSSSVTATALSHAAEDKSIRETIDALDLSAVPDLDQTKVRALLQAHGSVFSAYGGDLGCTKLISHEIPLLDKTPVRQRYRRIPPSEYEAVKSHIRQLLDSQVIRESSSPYASPIVLVKKKDGSLRMCVDYRQLNSKTRKDAFPLPRIEETLDSLSGARWFSTLDLASGYNQVPVAEKDKQKTAFCTPFGLFAFNRMPFGLSNAPSTFQRLMERMFGDQRHQSLLLYLDDVVVFSTTVDEHVQCLAMVLGRLQQEGLKAKLEKCCFLKKEVNYLGHVISSSGVSTDPGKVAAVSNWARPTNVSELRSFLGFASYYRRFVEGFAKLAAPLHHLVAQLTGVNKRSRVGNLVENWTEACERGFQDLKARLVTAPTLAYANFALPLSWTLTPATVDLEPCCHRNRMAL